MARIYHYVVKTTGREWAHREVSKHLAGTKTMQVCGPYSSKNIAVAVGITLNAQQPMHTLGGCKR